MSSKGEKLVWREKIPPFIRDDGFCLRWTLCFKLPDRPEDWGNCCFFHHRSGIATCDVVTSILRLACLFAISLRRNYLFFHYNRHFFKKHNSKEQKEKYLWISNQNFFLVLFPKQNMMIIRQQFFFRCPGRFWISQRQIF